MHTSLVNTPPRAKICGWVDEQEVSTLEDYIVSIVDEFCVEIIATPL